MKKVITHLRSIIGFSIPHSSKKNKKVSTKNWTSLSLEQLESRDLLAVLLPAPSTALSQYPASNPSLPTGIETFSPPVADVAVAPLAPQLATLTDQANPDDSLAATGYQFSNLAGS